MYGTMEDFDELLETAHSMNIKIIMDLVVNHTSDQHEWFLKSKSSRDNEYSDFYIWKDPKEDGSEPTNWGATFGGSAWTYVPERKQYYMSPFLIFAISLTIAYAIYYAVMIKIGRASCRERV